VQDNSSQGTGIVLAVVVGPRGLIWGQVMAAVRRSIFPMRLLIIAMSFAMCLQNTRVMITHGSLVNIRGWG